MKLIVAQGNPGNQYHDTRHNIGFRVLDSYAAIKEASWDEKPKFHSYIAQFSESNEKILLVKPTTYYNDTGLAVRAIADFYKISIHDILVIHDDIALPLGTIRTRLQGSDAGNNGIKSLNSHLGQHFSRIRIGIWSERARQIETTAFVLAKFTKEEQVHVAKIETTVHASITAFLHNNFEATSYKVPIDSDKKEQLS